MSNLAKKPVAVPRATNIKIPKPTGSNATTKVAKATTASVDGLAAFNLPPQGRIAVIRQGIPASMIGSLSSRMGISKEMLLTSLGLSRATISRKERQATALSPDESERVLGVEALIGQVQKMVNESGDPVGFDAARWMGRWITGPVPALGGKTPASYLDTFEGQKLVANLLAMSQSGAYA